LAATRPLEEEQLRISPRLIAGASVALVVTSVFLSGDRTLAIQNSEDKAPTGPL